MPEESTTPDLVERVRRAFEAANRGDLDAVIRSFASDGVFAGRAVGCFDPIAPIAEPVDAHGKLVQAGSIYVHRRRRIDVDMTEKASTSQ